MASAVANRLPQCCCCEKDLDVDSHSLRPGLNTRRIRSIHVAKEDEHVFLADWGNESIIELSERGEMLSELRFSEGNHLCFSPFDVCSIAPNTLAVCGASGWRGAEGEKIRAIKVDGLTTGSMGSIWSIWSRIRVDPSTGNFWGSRYDCPEIVSFNFEGEKLDSVKKMGKQFFDFSFDKYGHLYFPTKEGIFSFSPENKTKKHLHQFSKKAELDFPVISISENKMVVWIKHEGKDLIKHFKIFY